MWRKLPCLVYYNIHNSKSKNKALGDYNNKQTEQKQIKLFHNVLAILQSYFSMMSTFVLCNQLFTFVWIIHNQHNLLSHISSISIISHAPKLSSILFVLQKHLCWYSICKIDVIWLNIWLSTMALLGQCPVFSQHCNLVWDEWDYINERTILNPC